MNIKRDTVRILPSQLKNVKQIVQLIQGTDITFENVANAMNSLEDKIKQEISKPLFKTLVKITCKRKGKKDQSFITANTCVLGGRLHTLEKPFGIKPTKELHLTQNDLLEIPHSVDIYTDPNNYWKDIKVLGFMIGDGAKNPQNINQEYKNRNDETKMYNAMPLRCVEETSDLSADEQKLYRGRKKIRINDKNYFAYFVKLIEVDKIYIQHNGSEYVPSFDDTEPVPKDIKIDPDTGYTTEQATGGPLGSSPVLIFTKIDIKIETNEFKEYYKLNNNGSLTNAGINELGLVMGVDLLNNQDGDVPRNEIANMELWAKMTFPNQTMASDNIAVYMEYLIYA